MSAGGGFAAMGLMPELIQCIEEEYGWLLPTDVQDEAIPLILGTMQRNEARVHYNTV